MKKKLIVTTTIPSSMRSLLNGQYKFLSQHYDVIAATSGGENYEKVIEEEGIRGYVIPFTRKTFSLVSDIKALFKLISVFRKEKPFIVHSQMSKDALLSMIAAWICRVPNRLYTVNGLGEMAGIKGVLLNIAEWVTFWCTTKVYSVSFNMLDIYVNKGMLRKNKGKVILNGSVNGFDINYFSRAEIDKKTTCQLHNELDIIENSFVFCTIGRVVGDKGINELVKAFSLLQKEFDNIHLLIIGSYEKELDPILKETEDSINKNKNIHFVGYKRDIRPYLCISNALVHASYREGFGNVIAEAGLMEIPCIVTDICGPNEIIRDGVNGSIIPRKDADALYNMMKYYYNNPDEVKRMGDSARQNIVNKYRRNDVWEAILEEYKSLEK